MPTRLRRRTVELRYLAQRPVIETSAFCAEETLAEVFACARLGLRERALELSVALLLRHATDGEVLMSRLGLEAPDDTSTLLADACAYGSVKLREKGLACLAQALAYGVDDDFALKRALTVLQLELPSVEELPIVTAELR